MNYIYWPVTKVLPEARDLTQNSHSTDGGINKPILVCATQSGLSDLRQPREVSFDRQMQKDERFDLAQRQRYAG
jgi:hypothetical protein